MNHTAQHLRRLGLRQLAFRQDRVQRGRQLSLAKRRQRDFLW